MNYNFRNLVFEGGGVKGIAYGGALDILDQMNILSNITRVAGTSAGAINAVLVALGYSSQEVSKIIAETNFKDFEDRKSFLASLYGFSKSFGWFKGDVFQEWLGRLIEDKTGSKNFTFGELYSAVETSQKSLRLLYIIATNLTKQSAQIFSHEKTPDVPIKYAVRMSMSIPLYFRSVKIFDDIMVDGGVSYNYPINLFDNVKYLSNPKNAGSSNADEKGYLFNHETLGFRLDSKESIKYYRDDWKSVSIEIKGIKDYALGLVNFMMEMANKSHLQPDDWNRTIFIDSLDVKTTDFSLSPDKINKLIASGQNCTKEYFKWRDADTEWSKYPVKP
jgi:NTE family protein